jgi:hypothetical protein
MECPGLRGEVRRREKRDIPGRWTAGAGSVIDTDWRAESERNEMDNSLAAAAEEGRAAKIQNTVC